MVICKRGRKENREWKGEIYLMENMIYIAHCKNECKKQKVMRIKQESCRKINSSKRNYNKSR